MKLVVEHPDGRRVSVEENRFDDPLCNPYNIARMVISIDAGSHWREIEDNVGGREPADHLSLRAEGFKVVSALDPQTGHEVALPEKYRTSDQSRRDWRGRFRKWLG